MLISIEHLIKYFGEKIILNDVNLTIENKGRYGLIGVNGAGKSTLLSIIIGELEADSGKIYKNSELSIGYLKQNSGLDRNSTIIQEMQIVFADVLKVENELRELEMKMSNSIEHDSPEFKAISSEYTKKQNFFDSRDGYQINVKIKTILNGLGFIDKDLNTVINTLSGGEKTRLAIARLLLEEPNLLILDEPTNHLDFKTLNWLEEYLLNYNGAILVVSHDRYFLDKIIDNVFELERRKVFTYKGNYSKYLVSKEERRVRYEKEYEAQQIQISGLQTYVDKNIARASTSASAKSRLKTLENMDILEKPNHDLKQIKLSFETIKESYKDVLTVNDLDVSVGDEHKIICKNISFEVKKGERIAIIGDNGIGKSSFFKTILSLIPHYKGDFFWGKNTSLSYYEQENLNLDPNNLAIDELWNRFPNIPEATIRKVLGNVLLTKEDVYKPVKVISGGERAKLAFCIIMLEKSNVILFDEPTNHLDLPSKEILEKALLKYDGTLIFISHDRYLLNKVPNKIIEIKNEGVIIYDGNFEYYKERSEMLKKIENQEKKIETSEKPKTSNYRSKEQRRAEVQMKNRIKEVELSINSIENEIQSLELELAKEEVYTDYILTGEKTQKLNDNNKLLEKLYEEWEELQEENDN